MEFTYDRVALVCLLSSLPRMVVSLTPPLQKPAFNFATLQRKVHMKILIASTPAPGHLNPLLSIASLLVESGHEVALMEKDLRRAKEIADEIGSIVIAHDGCEAIHLRRDQDDPTHIVSFTQWASRQHYVDYFAWRTEAGLTDELADMLTEPLSIEYFDDIVSVTR